MIFPMRRIKGVFYAVNGLGLGHLTRLLSIALELKIVSGGYFEPFFFTTSEAAHILSEYDIPFIQIPSKPLTQRSGQFTFAEWARLINSIVQCAFENIKPDLLIVDTFPIGTARELEHILRFADCLKVFIHRASKRDSYTRESIESQNLYHLILIPHDKEKGHVDIPIPENFSGEIFYSGPIFLSNIAGIDRSIPKDVAIKLLGLKNNTLKIYVTFGGGGDPNILSSENTILKIITDVTPSAQIFIGKGPLARFSNSIGDTGNGRENIKISHIFPICSYLSAFDFAIASSGYNTYHELMYAGIPTIFIPRVRGLDDQEARIKFAVDKTAALTVPENSADFEVELSNAINKLTQPVERDLFSHNAKKIVPNNNSEKAAGKIWEYFEY